MAFPNNARKRANILRLIEGMKARNDPIHALGLQSHLRSRYGFNATLVRRFIAEVAGLGACLLNPGELGFEPLKPVGEPDAANSRIRFDVRVGGSFAAIVRCTVSE